MTNEFRNPNIRWPLLSTSFELRAIINQERGRRTSSRSGNCWLWIINDPHFYKFDQSNLIFIYFVRTQSHTTDVWRLNTYFECKAISHERGKIIYIVLTKVVAF
jgi:hypothetical protein